MRSYIKVNKKALFTEFEKKGIKPSLAAQVCEKTSSYFSNCEVNGINDDVARRLRDRLGIDIYALPGPADRETPEQVGMFTRSDDVLVEILAELRKISDTLGGDDGDHE